MPTKHVVITGGSKGIGKAILEKCAQHGFSPVCIARSPYQGSCADQVLSIQCDLSDPDAARKCFEELDARKILASYLVNNAGALVGKHLHALTHEEIELQKHA